MDLSNVTDGIFKISGCVCVWGVFYTLVFRNPQLKFDPSGHSPTVKSSWLLLWKGAGSTEMMLGAVRPSKGAMGMPIWRSCAWILRTFSPGRLSLNPRILSWGQGFPSLQ